MSVTRIFRQPLVRPFAKSLLLKSGEDTRQQHERTGQYCCSVQRHYYRMRSTSLGASHLVETAILALDSSTANMRKP